MMEKREFFTRFAFELVTVFALILVGGVALTMLSQVAGWESYGWTILDFEIYRFSRTPEEISGTAGPGAFLIGALLAAGNGFGRWLFARLYKGPFDA